MAKKDIRKYLQEVRKIYQGGDYTEFTLRTPFENLIKSLNPNYNLIQEPKRVINLGAPDFKALIGSVNVGYIETKILGENLDNVIKSDQLEKYIEGINNLILTDYARFILIRKGEIRTDLSLFTTMNLDNSNFRISDECLDAFIQLIDEFYDYKLQTIKSAEVLAKELAKKAKLLKELVTIQLKADMKSIQDNEIPSPIYDFFVGIKGLIKGISLKDGADAFAQTVTYGLFLARINSPGELTRESAYAYIPKNIGTIKRMFINISGSDIPNISGILDDTVAILNSTNLDEVFSRIDKRGKKDKDPMIYLYEDFLNHYEPKKKVKLGVYYTPRPVVNFIVNSTHIILKNHFNKVTGLADNSVTVLDPASGTGTFFWIAYLVVLNELKKQGLMGIKRETIQNHLLKHFYGFEILITSYIIAHLKLSDLLYKWGYKFKDADRVQIFLTNTLEPSEDAQTSFSPFLRELSMENIATSQIKSKKPIIAIIGNPPYAGSSSNKGKWIDNLLKIGYKRPDGQIDEGYYKINGEPLGERNPKWLQDDYVKFIRFSQWKIDQNGEGIVSFITNHSFIDNPTFRGMRESLLKSFDRIYILNLHGNVKKKEKCPDGSKDENVFDIEQGVSINIFVKNSGFTDKKIYYSDLWGLREYKYAWLDRHTIINVDWQEIDPITEFYFLIPFDNSILVEYEKFWKIKDIFPVNTIGLFTAKDPFTIQKTKKDVQDIINDFAYLEIEKARKKYKLGKDTGNWSINRAQKDLISSGLDESKIVPLLYRPFDTHYTYYTGTTSGFHARPRKNMSNMLKDNLGIVIGRQWGAVGSQSYDTVTVSDKIIDLNIFRRGGGMICPLYIDGIPNISPLLIKEISDKYGVKSSPEEIFNYIYALLHSPNYRKKYEPILRYDFPRIPFVKDYERFKQISDIGKELIDLHLFRKTLPAKTKFDIEGSNIVEEWKYIKGKLWINKEQFFEGIPLNVWEFNIGGYPVIQRYIKDRKNTKLIRSEILKLRQIIEIIKLTIISMKKIDEIFEKG